MVCKPVVVVGHHHEPVAGVEAVFLPKHPRPNVLVELNRPLVGPGDHHDVVLPVLGVQVDKQLFQILAAHTLQSCAKLEVRQGRWPLGFRHAHEHAEVVGVAEDGAVEFLADDVFQGDLSQREPKVHLQRISLQGRTQRSSHGRQLGVVPDQHQSAALARVHKLHEVVEQAPVLKAAGREPRRLPDHGRFVHHKEGVRSLVGHQPVARAAVRRAHGTVDVPVNGRRGLAGMFGQDLGGPPRGSQEHATLTHLPQRADHSAHRGGLSGPRVASQDEGAPGFFRDDEPRPHEGKPRL